MSRSVYGRLKAGEFEGPQLAKERLEVIIPISLVRIMVLLYGLFNSLRDSFLALAGIPFVVAACWHCISLDWISASHQPSASYRFSGCRSWTAF